MAPQNFISPRVQGTTGQLAPQGIPQGRGKPRATSNDAQAHGAIRSAQNVGKIYHDDGSGQPNEQLLHPQGQAVNQKYFGALGLPGMD